MGGIYLNSLGLFIIVVGIIYLIYSIVFRNKKTIYFKNIKISKGRKDEYLKLQLYFALLNSLILIIIGSIIVGYNLNSPFIYLVPILNHIVNFIMNQVGKKKGYIEF